MKNSGKTWLLYERHLDEETGLIWRTRGRRFPSEAEARSAASEANKFASVVCRTHVLAPGATVNTRHAYQGEIDRAASAVRREAGEAGA